MRISACSLLICLAATPSFADNSPRVRNVDFSLQWLPVTNLAIRQPVPAASSEPVQKTKAVTSNADPTEAPLTTTLVGSKRRDYEERVTARLNAGFAVDSGRASGEPTLSGALPNQTIAPRGQQFNQFRPYFLGDAVLGTRGFLVPSMQTYFLSQFSFQAEGPSQFNALNNVYDSRSGRGLLLYAAYAEADGFGPKDSLISKVKFRAGRQFHYGSSRFVANFDGISASLVQPDYKVTAFGGRRASAFFWRDPGYLGGLSFRYTNRELLGAPLSIGADYLFITAAGVRDVDDDGQNEFDSLTRHYLELSARTRVKEARVRLNARLVDNGDFTDKGKGLARLGIAIRWPMLDNKLLLYLATEHRLARAVSYDFISPAPQDVVDLTTQLGVGLDAPEDATRGTLRLSAMWGRLETLIFARANLVSESNLSGFQQDWFEQGLAIAAQINAQLNLNLQYKSRFLDLQTKVAETGDEFRDTSGAGAKTFHEVSGEIRYARSKRSLSGSAGAYFRVYDFRSPYANVNSDSRGGGRVLVNYWVNKKAKLKFAGEVAQLSPTFARELSTLFSFRAIGEFLF